MLSKILESPERVGRSLPSWGPSCPPPPQCPFLFLLPPRAHCSPFFFPLQERFVDLYGNDAAAEMRKGQETFNKWLLTGATVAGVLLLGSLLSRK